MNGEILQMPITIQEAYHLMGVLENDIPYWQRSKIALLLLILSANPKMVEQGDAITDKHSQRSYYGVGGRADWYGYDGY